MKCRLCNGSIRTIDTVHNEDEGEIYRLKKCPSCGFSFYTVEYEVEENEKFKTEWRKHHRNYN